MAHAEQSKAGDEALYAVEGHVATITLNAPERMNTISAPMMRLLREHLLTAESDANVRAVILTGAGRAFCAGLDLRPRASDAERIVANFTKFDTREMPPGILAVMDKPVIAAVNGAAAGFGMDLALLADFRIMAGSAKFSTTYIKRGLIPESGVTWLLPRLIGWEKASELLMIGRTLSGDECVEWGLARDCVADGELMPSARTLAREIAAGPPLTVQAAKRLMRASLAEPLLQHMQHAFTQLRTLVATKDTQEGIAAFLEKREPVFTGE